MGGAPPPPLWLCTAGLPETGQNGRVWGVEDQATGGGGGAESTTLIRASFPDVDERMAVRELARRHEFIDTHAHQRQPHALHRIQ